MVCEMRVIKNLFLFFNFILVLWGLAYLIIGVLALIGNNYYSENLGDGISKLILQTSIKLIVISCIIVFIAFLGFCGAIRENYCMIVTFATLLLTILIIEVIGAIYMFVIANNSNEISFKDAYTVTFNNYLKGGRKTVDFMQETFECCGVDGPDDFARLLHISIPGTCCEKSTNDICDQMHSYKTGCVDALKEKSRYKPGDIALFVIEVGIELSNVIVALCLANSIKNAKR